jgi:galactokinase/mevalonate kinase-like predicted kinase
VIKGDTAGKFDFSIYDNLRKSVQANPLFSASGFLNLDEVKLEEVTLASMAKKSGNALQDLFKFVVEGSQQFSKGVEEAVKTGIKVVEDVKSKAVEIVNDLKAKTEEIIKVADGEIKKFMNVAEKAYKDVVSTVQKASQGAIDFIAQNADLLKTVSGVVGGIGSGLVTALPQLMNLIPGWYVVL